jgi:predicted protein tyrosine phosphatase
LTKRWAAALESWRQLEIVKRMEKAFRAKAQRKEKPKAQRKQLHCFFAPSVFCFFAPLREIVRPQTFNLAYD